MPQMSPMNWMNISILFMTMLIIITMSIYYFHNPKKVFFDTKIFQNKKMKWNWTW